MIAQNLTELELQEIRERCGKITKGEWNHLYDGESLDEVFTTNNAFVSNIAECDCKEDAEFIVHSKTDISRLLNEIELLKDKIYGLEMELAYTDDGRELYKRESEERQKVLEQIKAIVEDEKAYPEFEHVGYAVQKLIIRTNV